jgi:NADPH:quinone reductase-like Zn-dependent oxidoreductase
VSAAPDDDRGAARAPLPATMRVAEYDRYGGPEVLVVRERPRPTPGRGQVLVRVRAAALNPKDVLVRAGKFRWLTGRRFPRRTGYDWAGEIAALGPGVDDLAVGARALGMIDAQAGGACGEYVVAERGELTRCPPGLAFAEAAALPLAGLTALQALRDLAALAAGQRLLVNGASGGVGTLAVQLGKALGAHVTAVTSARNHELARGLGADDVLDYAVADLARPARPYDVVFDVFGNRSFAALRAALAPRGTYVTTVPSARAVIDHLRTRLGGRRARLVVVRSRAADLDELLALHARGALTPVVDRRFPLAELADAHRYLATRRARGKVVITID